MRHVIRGLVLLVGPVSLALGNSDSDLSAGERIVREAKRRSEPETEKTVYQMELRDERGDLRHRDLVMYFKRQPETTSTLLKFTDPRNFEGVGILITRKDDRDPEIWSYLPTTRRLRRISGKQKRNWFMGTEFTYEDFDGYQLALHSYTLLGTKPCGEDRECFLVQSVPKTESERESTAYERQIYWIDTTNFALLVTEFYDKEDTLWKTLTTQSNREVEGYVRPHVQTMKNLRNGRSTRLEESERIIDEPLDEYYLSRRYLRAN